MMQMTIQVPSFVVCRCLCAVALLSVSALCHAQTASTSAGQAYPTKPMRMIVPFAPGGPNDLVARVVGQKLTESWGQTLIIDNRGGAGGNIGVTLAARASADGYTLLMVGLHFVVNPSLYANAGYDVERDFAPITNAAVSATILVVHPSLAARDLREFVQLAKRGGLDYGSPGTGTAGHLAAELLNTAAGIKIQHIPYKGAALAISDLLGGQIKSAMFALPGATPHVRAGKMRAIAVSTLQRSAALPDVPTVAESGYPGFFVDNIYGILAPRGTPDSIVTQLHTAIAAALKAPDVRERLIAQGYEPLANTPAQFAVYLRAETTKWAKLVKDSGMRTE